jgi:TonB-dependent SusC/RagA subfamily outer membrane receptor
MSRVVVRSLIAVLALGWARSVPLAAQTAVTISGHVTSSGRPLSGAHVRIAELGLERSTDAFGRYSFVVPSADVRGQTVKLVASASDRRVRYAPLTTPIVLTGEALVRDFDLKLATERDSIALVESAAAAPGPGVTRRIDTLNLSETLGAVDIASALAGRFPGLAVSTASTLGGSPSLTFRGPRSVLGPNQPLFVIDGLPVSNTVFASSAARFGAGGFDYGSPLGDLDLSEVASITVLSPVDASAAYGSRGANGVVVITTKDGSDGPRFGIAARYQTSNASYARLPSFQNSYGQGLNGQFAFFNGRGGGVNDAVDQSWGPALDGRAVSQSSYTEAGRNDVRLWNPQPDNVRNYFSSGRTSTFNASMQGMNDLGAFRASFGAQQSHGITPRDQLSRLDGSLHGLLHPMPRLELGVDAFGAQSKHRNAPGAGMAEANPVFQFTRMGRQVDTDSLRNHLRDAAGKQVSWIYTTHNNPYALALSDSNSSRRYHLTSSGHGTLGLTRTLTATVRGGVDYYRDGRLFSLGNGWMGGFPFYAGAGDFSKGGSEGDEIGAQTNSLSATLDGSHTVGGTRWTFGGGADAQRSRFRIRSLGVDSAVNVPAAGAPDTARLPSLLAWTAHSGRNTAFGQAGVTFADGLTLGATLRNAWTSPVGAQTTSSLLPAVRASWDLKRAVDGLTKSGSVTGMSIDGALWKDATELDPYTIETMYAGRALSGSIVPSGSGLLLPDPSLAPEIVTGWQIGGQTSFDLLHLGLGLTYYNDQTTGVILPVANSALGTVSAKNAGQVTNSGIEGRVSFQLGNGTFAPSWAASLNVAKNSNSVDKLSTGATSLPLGPSQFGLSVTAREGQPLGVLLGYRTLRDRQTNTLLLRNGLPLPDSAAGPQVLGVAQPDWVFGLQNTFRYRIVTLSLSADGKFGGQVFSATNLSGSYAGTLATTAFRPDTGLLIVGIDNATRAPNTRHVSTQDYYHALGAIQEPWVYSASYYKLREAKLSVEFPPIPFMPMSALTASLIGRNLVTWAKAPNIDPEAVFSPYQLPGVEMGQLPYAKSLAFQLTITP